MTQGPQPHRIAVVGGGIVGLSLARALGLRRPGVDVVVFEKEAQLATHQTARNSGVVHAGLYYQPGSLKARLCVEGMRRLREYCLEHGLAYQACGKLVIALTGEEASRLRALAQRAESNGVEGLRLLGPEGIRDVEPQATGQLALHSPATAIVDFAGVARRLADDVRAAGGDIRLRTAVRGLRRRGDGVEVLAGAPPERFDRLVNCAGLHADRLAVLAGDAPGPRIVPFRGDYYLLRPPARNLVRGLIYPMPDPRYPFLGVHLTRRIDGNVLVGPNALLAFAREGYRLGQVRAADVRDIVSWPGFRRMAARHWRTGVAEMRRSVSRRFVAAEASCYVPAVRPADLIRGPSGIRAQAIDADGTLVDDFRVSRRGPVVNVRNAPSPAATSSLAIAELLADEVFATAAG